MGNNGEIHFIKQTPICCPKCKQELVLKGDADSDKLMVCIYHRCPVVACIPVPGPEKYPIIKPIYSIGEQFHV